MLGNQKSFGKRSLFILEDWRQQNVTFSHRTGFLPCLSTYLATLICVPTWMIILYREVHFNWSQLTLLKNLPLEYELLQQNVWVREVMTCKFWLVNHEFPVPVNTLDQDSLAWLEVITTNLAQGVVLRDLRPGLVTWRHLYDLSGHAVSMSMKFYSKLWSFCRPWSRWSNWIWINNHFAVDFSLGGL